MPLTCMVETPQGSRNKYEYDPERGAVFLDRRLFSSIVFPADYGFLEGTHGPDGRHLDALVLVSDPTFPGCRIDVRPLGLFRMRDEEGVDDKVICVPVHDPDWADVHEVIHISQRLRDEIAHFFAVYKDLEPDRATALEGWGDRAAAERAIAAATDRAGAATQAPPHPPGVPARR